MHQRVDVADSLIVAGVRPEDLCPGEDGDGDLRRYGVNRSAAADLSPPAGSIGRLGPVLPNPAHHACTVRFRLAREGRTALAIYDASGRRIRSLMSGRSAAGDREVRWDGRDDAARSVPEGVYLVRLDLASETHAAKVLLLH